MVRELGDTLVRDMRSDDTASGYGPLAETLRHQDAGSVFRGGNAVQETSHADRTQRTRTDVRDDNRDHYTPSKFGVKLCQMWIDALKTDDEQWYLDGYDLYIDRVIFNPNVN